MENYSEAAIAIVNELHTERLDYGSEYMPIIDALLKLQDYEEAEEQGRMIKFPCRVGDTISHYRANGEWISAKVTNISYSSKIGVVINAPKAFHPIKADEYTFAPIEEFPYSLADYYIGEVK